MLPLTASSRKTKYGNQTGWLTVGGKKHYFKSKAEMRYAAFLEWEKAQGIIEEWLYEPKVFVFPCERRGRTSYKPDFKISQKDGLGEDSHFWVEVKGYMTPACKTKLRRFNKYFPEEKIIVVDAKWFSRNAKKLKGLVPGWV
jgi:hypothetical protein